MKHLIIFFFLFVLSACVSTDINSIVAFKYKDNFKAKKILIVALGLSPVEQQQMEQALAMYLSKYDIIVLQSSTIFASEKDHSSQNIQNLSKQKLVDSILIINASKGSHKDYTPPQFIPPRTVSYVYQNGSYFAVENRIILGYFIDGYTRIKPALLFNISLENPENKETIWLAEGVSYDGYNDFSMSLINDIAKETASLLFQQGIITKKFS